MKYEAWAIVSLSGRSYVRTMVHLGSVIELPR